jgi:hypothetical protein
MIINRQLKYKRSRGSALNVVLLFVCVCVCVCVCVWILEKIYIQPTKSALTSCFLDLEIHCTIYVCLCQ